MATVRWTPLASRRSQVGTVTVSGTPAAGNVATVTINSKSVTYTVLSGDAIADVAASLVALLRAAPDGEFQLITWTVDAAVITATAATPGVPFTVTGGSTLTVASTGGGATTLTAASVTTNSSPNDVANVLNYSSGALPSGADTLLVHDTDEPMRWNLDALAALTLTVIFRDTFQPNTPCWVGNPTNEPTLNFREFRGTELSFTGTTTLEINLPSGAPAGAFRINSGSAQSAVKIFGDGSGTLGQEAVEWRGTHASNAVTVLGGSLAVHPLIFSSSGTAVFLTLNAINSAVTLGTGVTVSTSAYARDSQIDTRVTIPTFTMDGSSSAGVFRDASACGTAMDLKAGTLLWNSSGGITGTLHVESEATISFANAKTAVTVGGATGTVILEEGATYDDPEKRTFPWTNVDTVKINGDMNKVTINGGAGLSIQLTSA